MSCPDVGHVPKTPADPKRLTIWEREALEIEQLDARQRERTASLEAQRVAELAQAEERGRARRREDVQRIAAEALQREKLEQARAANLTKVAEQHVRSCAQAEESMLAEQQALAAEGLRQAAVRANREPTTTRTSSDDTLYTWEDGMDKRIKTFRQRGGRGDALIIKIDQENSMLKVEESVKSMELEDLAERLDDDQSSPRYVLYIHERKHADG
jgi:hypothetical protein